MTQLKSLYLTSMSHHHPEHVIDNHFFDELEIGSDAQWIEDRTGIRSRRSVLSPQQILDIRFRDVKVADLFRNREIESCAAMVDQSMALLKERDAGFEGDRVGLLTCGTSVPDFDIPANACTVAAKIGVSAFACDINSACSSFVTNLHWQRMWMQSRDDVDESMIVNPERYSTRMNFDDRSSCILFGDGAVTAALSTSRQVGLEVLDTMVWSDPSKNELVTIPVYETFWQNGSAVQKFAITRTMEGVTLILEKNGLSIQDVRYVVGHQANLRMLRASVRKLGLDDDCHLYNVDEYGNQGAAGAPSALSQGWERLQSGDIIVMAVVGAGLTWGSALFRKV